MKKRTLFFRSFPVAALILSIFASLMLSACVGNKKEPVLPPIRMSERSSHGSIGGSMTTLEAEVNYSDAVACVRIGDWLGDHSDKVTTKFEAEVIEVIKGELPTKITLLQDGTSESTFANYPLFTAGNELLVLLKKSNSKAAQNENTYWITGSYFTVFDIVTFDSGEEYALARRSLLADTLQGTVRDLSGDNMLGESVLNELKRNDSIWNEVNRERTNIYSLDELISAIKGY